MRFALCLVLLLAVPAFAHEHADHAAPKHEKMPAAATPVQTTAEGAVYGAKLPADVPAAVSLDAVVAKPEPLLGKSGAFSGRITQVCQQMGCWMVLTAENGEFVRVNMHEHAFSIPKDAKGDAIAYGTLSRKELSAKEIEHLKKDGAKAPATSELQIDANSVLIRSAP
ncbi:DUF4920 domain-containing protein [Dokdonella sp.]|uniref:DUF4920 domain-containing protein n=1 Tax=Dokdonella sp. TaxID=2291710 RepID=UPI0025BD2D78|nr:DUF4920 domain-containing protein [Dokdonella sp.]MBX3688747.1 DUF4920 domain-containing protein [Dokdonella sp.]